jgi:hypothetical protein
MNHHIDSIEPPCPCVVVDAQIGGNYLRIIARIQAEQSKRDAAIRKVSAQFGTDAARGTGDQYGFVQRAAPDPWFPRPSCSRYHMLRATGHALLP